jgi:hypothetical protein
MTLWNVLIIYDDRDEMLQKESMSLWAVDKLDVIISIGYIYSKRKDHLRSVIFEEGTTDDE